MTPVAATDPLAALRGYRLPGPVSWWPPALGWWALAVLAILLACAAGWWVLRRWRRAAAARAAKAELAALRAALERDGDTAAFARGLSRLLRRFALTRFPRREVAGLAGEAWLRFLDDRGGEGRFLGGPGRLLVEAPYRSAGELPAADLAALVQAWIDRNARGQA